MIYGYARCSTNEDKQDINRQIRELKAAEGDTIITLEISRLSRSTKQLCDIIDIIRKKHLRLVIVGNITITSRRRPRPSWSEIRFPIQSENEQEPNAFDRLRLVLVISLLFSISYCLAIGALFVGIQGGFSIFRQ